MVMDAVIRFALSNIPFVCLGLGIVAALAAIALSGRHRAAGMLADRLLAWHVFFAVGVNYLYNFVVHVFFGEFAAQYIGWAQSPFQAEVGFASLGFAAVGFIAFAGGWTTRAAAVVASACFLWGAAAGHVYQMATAGDFAPGNAGSVFWSDLAIPAVGFLFLAWAWRRPGPYARSVPDSGSRSPSSPSRGTLANQA